MGATKKEIIDRLQQEILQLQGFIPPLNTAIPMGLGPIATAFPNGTFPTAAIHEFLCDGSEDIAATGGFIAGLLASLMRGGTVCLWISKARNLFPPALAALGITPDQVVFIDLKREIDVLWALEEALKCEGLAAVVGEIKDLSFTASRRFQLAVEKSRVTGFIVRQQPRDLNANACVARWKINSQPSALPGDLPGVGNPRWNVQLLKVRNGTPGKWLVEFAEGRYISITGADEQLQIDHARKIG